MPSNSLRILLIGGGGREHALAWKIAQSPRCAKLFCTPGNPGIAAHAECFSVPLSPDSKFAEVIAACGERKIDLVVVGPERPLADGIADALEAAGIACFGPTQAGAQLESSKRFAKELMAEAGIPTAAAQTFTDLEPALAYLKTQSMPIVIKAAGLAEGKGVTVAHTPDEAQAALRACLEGGAFGEAGREVLIEEFLEGEEASMLAFCDGRVVRAMDSAQDHKPVNDNDEGPNTGGMGAYSPAPVVTTDVRNACILQVLQPCLDALKARGIEYRGVIYAGLMVSKTGVPNVIEFNCRFGDPETQALLPRLENDLVDVMIACIDGSLDRTVLRWSPQPCVCVVAASGGYPGAYEKGKVITGFEKVRVNKEVMIFHAGTAQDEHKRIVTSGGRVLGITVKTGDLRAAIKLAYIIMARIQFEGMHFRTDIGNRALLR